jgi:tetratricopeptide (TPR) repeat protein
MTTKRLTGVLLIAVMAWNGGCAMTESDEPAATAGDEKGDEAGAGADESSAAELPAVAEDAGPALPEWRKMWNFGDPAGTEARFREAIAAGEDAGDEEYVLIVTTQLARTQGLQRNWKAAHETLDEVEEELEGRSVELRMRYLLERGRTLNSSGDPGASALLFEDAWALGQGADEDVLTADAGHMLAIVLPPRNALEWAEKTMQFCEDSPDERCQGWLGPLYNNTGWTYHDKGDYEKALELWEKSLTFREAQGAPDPIFISRWTIGRCYRSMARYQDALALQHQLHEDRAAAGNPGKGYVEEEIGECLLALDRADDAKPWFAKAYDMLSKSDWFVAEEPERLARIKELGGR